jgi:hypothetical protein
LHDGSLLSDEGRLGTAAMHGAVNDHFSVRVRGSRRRGFESACCPLVGYRIGRRLALRLTRYGPQTPKSTQGGSGAVEVEP